LPIYYLEGNRGYNSSNSTNVNNENNNNFSSYIPRKKKVLLVDDEPDITSSLKIGLEDNGFAVDIAVPEIHNLQCCSMQEKQGELGVLSVHMSL
jgi:hypothetical protein